MAVFWNDAVVRSSGLAQDDREAVRLVYSTNPRRIKRGELLADPGFAYLIVEGWFGDFASLRDGRVQVVSLYMPGDFRGNPWHRGGSSTEALTNGAAFEAPIYRLEELTRTRPRISAAFQRIDLIQRMMLLERILCLGQRTGIERCAHIICELFWRLRAAGRVRGATFEFPLTQSLLGAVIGVTNVQANRLMQVLRSEGLIEQNGQQLTIRSRRGLQERALFSPDYLHLAEHIEVSAAPKALTSIGRLAVSDPRTSP